jgi:hypothetical protein
MGAVVVRPGGVYFDRLGLQGGGGGRLHVIKSL